MASFAMDPDGLAQIDAAITRVKTKVIEQIAEDARRYAPKRTGHLAESIEAQPQNDRVVVHADYGVFVELGHHEVAWGHDEHRMAPPEPFMRPALYQERAL